MGNGIKASHLFKIFNKHFILVSCDVTQLRERYKTLSRMIQDAQRSVISFYSYFEVQGFQYFSDDGSSQDTSFMSGPHSDSDFIDLTQKFWAHFIRLVPRNKIWNPIIDSRLCVSIFSAWQREQSPCIDSGVPASALTGSRGCCFC